MNPDRPQITPRLRRALRPTTRAKLLFAQAEQFLRRDGVRPLPDRGIGWPLAMTRLIHLWYRRMAWSRKGKRGPRP
jgi:hypothetical protein